jgi:cysteine protease ATG4
MSQYAHGITSLDCSDSETCLSTKVYMLGSCYDPIIDKENAFLAYKKAFESILWFTYRRDFQPMIPYEYTTDAGWGCMLRSAQMMLGEALQRRILGREWKIIPERLDQAYITLLQWFVDAPDPSCYYSLHHMINLGLKYDKSTW